MAAPQKTQNLSPKPAPRLSDESQMPFGTKNYIGTFIGLFLVVFGFYLMVGEKFIDANEFSNSLYVAPPVIVIGFAVIVYSIIMNPGKNKDKEAESGQ